MNTAVITPRPTAQTAPERTRSAYDSLMAVLRQRATARSFDPTQGMTDETYRLILDAARLAPSGANAQPWHFIVVASAWTKHVLANALMDARPEGIDYRALESAAGCIVVVTDYRLTWAFPGVMNGTEMQQRYHANAERIILQSVAAATTAAHLAAAALGYHSWWISLLGQDEAQAALRPLLGVPEDLTITDVMMFGRAAAPPRPRWKRRLDEVASWDRFNLENFRSVAQIDAWIKDLADKLGRPPAQPPRARLPKT
jgi:nitroreductase